MTKGIIFDFDGVLIDYSYRYHKTYEDVLAEYNLSCPSREKIIEIRRNLNDCNDSQIVMLDNFLVPRDNLNREKIIIECAEKRKNIIEKEVYLKLDKFYDESWEVVKKYKEDNFKIGLITKRKNKRLFLEQLGGNSMYLDFIENTQNKKKFILKFISKYDLNKCYFVTDTSNDVKEGEKTGALIIGILTGVENEKMLREAGAKIIINRLNELYSVVNK